jgi:DNA-binding transcriptional ArsR family regulator
MTNDQRAFALLADPTRREILERLAKGPKPVGEIARGMQVSRPAVSQHLKAMKEAGLVRDHAQGSRRVYQIDPAGLGPMRAWLDRFWGEKLQNFRSEIEDEENNNGRHSKG